MSEDIDPPFDYMKAVVGQSVGKFLPRTIFASAQTDRVRDGENLAIEGHTGDVAARTKGSAAGPRKMARGAIMR